MWRYGGGQMGWVQLPAPASPTQKSPKIPKNPQTSSLPIEIGHAPVADSGSNFFACHDVGEIVSGLYAAGPGVCMIQRERHPDAEDARPLHELGGRGDIGPGSVVEGGAAETR